MKKLILAVILSIIASPTFAQVQRIDPNAMEVTPSGSSTSDSLADWLGAFPAENIILPADRIVTGTTDTITENDAGTLIIDRNASGVTHTLPSAATSGMTDRFMFGVSNEGADSIISSASQLYGSYESFLIKHVDSCWFVNRLSAAWGADPANCYGPTRYNANFGTYTTTATLDGRISYTNASATSRYYFGSTGYLTATTGATTVRIDYNPETLASNNLLITPKKTNLYNLSSITTYNGFFNESGTTIGTETQPMITGSSGTWGKATESTATSTHRISANNIAYTSGEKYSSTIYFLAGTATSMTAVSSSPLTTGIAQSFDLTDCTLGSGTNPEYFSISKARLSTSPSKWACKVQTKGIPAISTATSPFGLRWCFNNNDKTKTTCPSYTGTGLVVYFTGFTAVQDTVPIHAFATGSASNAEDNVSIATDYAYNFSRTEGTICVKNADISENKSDGVIISATDTTDIFMGISSGGNLQTYDGTNTIDLGVSMPAAGTRLSACVAYNGSTVTGAVNGSVGTSQSYDGYTATNIKVGSDKDGLNGIQMFVGKPVVIYPSALSTSDLIRASATP